jgi:hypothetical protein
MTCGRIAIGSAPRSIVRMIALYLKELGIAGPIGRIENLNPEINAAVLEDWILNLLASFFYQLHRTPTTRIPGFAVRGLLVEEQRLAQFLHRIYVPKLLRFGWILQDRTKIITVHPLIGNKIDAWMSVNSSG